MNQKFPEKSIYAILPHLNDVIILALEAKVSKILTSISFGNTCTMFKLENVHWISVPVQISDLIRGATWRVVLKHYRPISPLLILWQRKTFGGG